MLRRGSAGKVLHEILEGILPYSDVGGHNSTGMGDDQKEYVLEVVVRFSRFVKGDLQRQIF